ncbi:MAG: aquaporin family protein [Chlorobiota bacterium]|nr:aquaporin family protein [Chlorobiota bacterium]QQS66277.1 MAG: aquaporin family protein [Chlorobiota bacterium]
MKIYIVEFIGTFFLILVIALTGNPIAIGAILAAMVYFGEQISGAHYNPAVTLGFLFSKKITISKAMRYWASQFLGAIFASLVAYYLSGKSFAVVPGSGVDFVKALICEIIFTFAIVSVIFEVTTSNVYGKPFYGLAFALVIIAASFTGGGISGGAFNPAVGIGPIIVDFILGGTSGSISNVALYLIGPSIGAILASMVFGILSKKDK